MWLLLLTLKPDAVLGQTAWTGGTLAALTGMVHSSCNSMVHTHGEPKLCNANYTLARFAYRYCRTILATNRAFAQTAREWGARRPIFLSGNIVEDVVPNITKNAEKQKIQFIDNCFHIVCVGRLVYEHGLETKGFSYAIKAMTNIKNAVLHIFGDGESRQNFECLAQEYDVADKVLFHGYVDRHTLYSALYAADALLMPSLSEGLSMTMIEGMMLSTPIVITKTSGANDYIINEKNGLLIDIASSYAISSAIKRLQDDLVFSREVAKNGRMTYEKCFTGECVAKSFLGALEGTGELA